MSNDEGTVDISGLEKAAVLAVLYNAAAPFGMGFLQTEHAPEVMTVEQAHGVMSGRGHDHQQEVRRFLPFLPGPVLSFTYVYGRPLKIDLNRDRARTDGYDYHHGLGAAAFAIGELRRTGSVCTDEVYAAHARRLQAEVRSVLSDPESIASFERDSGFGDLTTRLAALARKALGATA